MSTDDEIEKWRPRPITPSPIRRLLIDAAMARRTVGVAFTRKELECVAIGKVTSVDATMVRLINGRNDEGYMIPIASISEVTALDGNGTVEPAKGG